MARMERTAEATAAQTAAAMEASTAQRAVWIVAAAEA
jgi:hypothetical protein